jgi:hypothetical protein
MQEPLVDESVWQVRVPRQEFEIGYSQLVSLEQVYSVGAKVNPLQEALDSECHTSKSSLLEDYNLD